MEGSIIRAGYLQFAPVFGEPETNLAMAVESLHEIEADLVVLPELPFTGYGFTDREELESMAEDPARSEAQVQRRKQGGGARRGGPCRGSFRGLRDPYTGA